MLVKGEGKMTITYENVIPSPIENTTVKKLLVDGIHKTYNITANAGYVLHDNTLDYFKIDENGNITNELVLDYTTEMTSCRWDYDFATNPRDFFAILK